jgi:hypothetical protein
MAEPPRSVATAEVVESGDAAEVVRSLGATLVGAVVAGWASLGEGAGSAAPVREAVGPRSSLVSAPVRSTPVQPTRTAATATDAVTVLPSFRTTPPR